MDIDIQEEDLDQTHRVGNPKVCKDDKPRPIIIMMCIVQCTKTKIN